MARILYVSILAVAAVSVDTSRSESAEEANHSVAMSVGQGSFAFWKSKPQLDEAMRLQLRPEQERFTDSEQKMTMDEAVTHLALQEAGELSKGFAELQNTSMALRREMDRLTESEGLTAAADKVASVTKARSALHELAQESMQVKQMTDELEERIQTKYSQLLEEHDLGASMDASENQLEKNDASVAAAAIKQHVQDSGTNVAASSEQAVADTAVEEFDGSWAAREAALDQKFYELAGKTDTLLTFADEIKMMMLAMDHLRKKEAEAVTDEENVGLTHEDMEQELSSAHEASRQAFAEEHVDSETPAPTTPRVHEKRTDPKIVAQNAHLQNIVLTSAVEMARIEQAANDVISGLTEVQKWKHSHDGSMASNERGAALKAKLDKAMNYLAVHEGEINERSAEIDKLMRAAGMPGM